jgi:hypothetical protein
VTGKSQFFGDEKPWPIGRRNSGVRGKLGLAQNGRISLLFREEGEGRLLRHSPAQTCRIIPEYRMKNLPINLLSLLARMICSKITADFVGDENLYLLNSTLYERSTRPVKLYVPLFTPPGVDQARYGGVSRLRVIASCGYGLGNDVLLLLLGLIPHIVRGIGVTDCNRNGSGLQSAHFWDHIKCLYRPGQDHIKCH